MDASNRNDMNNKSVKCDVDTMLWSMKLYATRRYNKHRFWEAETQDADYAARIEPFPRLESVAEHSWHVADTVLLLAGYFPSLDRNRCLRMAILHDKMELYTGDKNPIGKSGTGSTTHAFNEGKRLRKELSERGAIRKYIKRLSPPIRSEQSRDLFELLEGETQEALFVKAIDKLQALAYVLMKKKGKFEDKHLEFTLRYSHKAIEYYPGLEPHYQELLGRLIGQVARVRNMSVEEMKKIFDKVEIARQPSLLPLNFPEEEEWR